METQLPNNQTLPPDLRDLLKKLHAEIDAKLHHRRKVLILDFLNHINSGACQNYYENRDLYIKLILFLNNAIKVGKYYLEDL